MRTVSSRALTGAALLVLVGGCTSFEGLATRYRAERMVWQAQREEQRLRIGTTRPDSAVILRIREAYQKPRRTFAPPFVPGAGRDVDRMRHDVARIVGMSELTAARYALTAGRADLTLESARWVSSIAGSDTSLQRQSDFATVTAMRALRRYEEAVDLMRSMLDRYPPIAPPSLEQEDPILGVPDAILELHEATDNAASVSNDQAFAVAYYRRLISRTPSPILESQVRARLSRTLLEMGDASAAFQEVTALQQLVLRTQSLRSLEPQILYTQARIRGIQKDYASALQMYDAVAKSYPSSPFAARGLLDAAVISERANDREGAVRRYRALMERPKPDPEIAPVAAFRLAMVEDLRGNWEAAKQVLETIPVQFPKSRAAVEAPFAIVSHYTRTGQASAAKGALVRAVDTYRSMIAQDTSSVYTTVYRWNLFRAYAALERWSDAMATVDVMAERDKGAPVTAEALFQGARIANAKEDNARADRYLRLIVAEYPKYPGLPVVRKALEEREKAVRKK